MEHEMQRTGMEPLRLRLPDISGPFSGAAMDCGMLRSRGGAGAPYILTEEYNVQYEAPSVQYVLAFHPYGDLSSVQKPSTTVHDAN